MGKGKDMGKLIVKVGYIKKEQCLAVKVQKEKSDLFAKAISSQIATLICGLREDGKKDYEINTILKSVCFDAWLSIGGMNDIVEEVDIE